MIKKLIFILLFIVNNDYIFGEPIWTNCIENQSCLPSEYYEPENIDQLKIQIQNAVSEKYKIRVVGGGYSISDLVNTNGYILNLKKLNRIFSIDLKNSIVHVEAGITLKDLNEQLGEYGLALSNQAAIDNLTLGGALSCAVHGTGRSGTLSSFIKEIDLVTADGKIHSLSLTSDSIAFAAARVGLGALGVIYTVKLQCEPLFYLQSIEEEWDINALILKYKELKEENEFFQFSWNVHTGCAIVTRRNRVQRLSQNLSGIETCYKALTYYTFDKNDKDLFSEIAVPIEKVPTVIEKVKKFADKYQSLNVKIADVIVRFAEANRISLLSPAANQSVAYVTMSIPINYDCPLFYKEFEDLLLENGGRPHWGKINFLDYQKLSQLYGENLEKFIAVKQRLDPLETFSNEFINRICRK